MQGCERHEQFRYEDYLVLIVFLDESEQARTGSSLEVPFFGSANEDFTSACRRYRNRVERNLQQSRDAHPGKNNSAEDAVSKSTQLSEKDPTQNGLPVFLYNPACFTAFGHSDSLGIVLVDDIDAMFSITMEVESAIEQVELSFVPKIQDLDIPEDELQYLMDISDLLSCRERLPEMVEGSQIDRKAECSDNFRYRAAIHEFEKQQPLIVVTRYKLGLLAVLGNGLVYQRAIFKAMARKTAQVLEDLRTYRPQESEPPLIDIEKDIDSFRYAFLDSQGKAEITTVMACTNYSVAVSTVVALRSLNLGDLFDVNDPEYQFVASDPVRQAIYHVHRNDDGDTEPEAPPETFDTEELHKTLPKNHVFSSTYSSLGFSRTLSNAQTNECCRGFLGVSIDLDINPGHLGSVQNVLAETPSLVTQTIGSVDRFHRFRVGRHDYSIDPKVDCTHKQNVPLHAVPTDELILFVKRLMKKFDVNAEIRGETDLQNVSSSLIVPLPVLKKKDANGNECDCIVGRLDEDLHIPLMSILHKINRRLFPRPNVSAKLHYEHPFKAGKFNWEEFASDLRRLGIPRRLRYAILRLYQNFSLALTDPHLIDSVLDLYDAFATFHTLIIDLIADEQDQTLKVETIKLKPRTRRGFLGTMADEITGFLHALHDALEHRIGTTRPHSEMRDISIGFHGGLNQLVSAADVPLKVGMGILKWLLRRTQSSSMKVASEKRDQVGAVTELTFNPITFSKTVQLSKKNDKCLVYVGMNIGEIMNPAEFVNYIHEAAHLIFRNYEREDALRFMKPHMINDDSVTVFCNRVEELYAEVFVFHFVHRGDCTLYLRHFFGMYNNLSIGIYEDDVAICQRLVEELFIAFCVIDPSDERREQNKSLHPIWTTDESQDLERTVIKSALKRFQAMVQEAEPYFAPFSQLRDKFGDSFTNFIDQLFCEYFRDTRFAAYHQWQCAKKIYDDYLDEHFPCQKGQNQKQELDRFSTIIEQALDKGDVSMQESLLVEDGPWCYCRDGETLRRVDELDSLLLTTQLLHEYLRVTFGDIDPHRVVHVFRDWNGNIKFPFNSQNELNRYMLDQGYTNVFCVEPEARSKKLMSEIVILKILWDISTRLRARRLVEIVEDNFPKFIHSRQPSAVSQQK